MTGHVLTIDLGTSGPKVALFTMAGKYVDGDFTPVELELLPNDGAEQSPDAWWRGSGSDTAEASPRKPNCTSVFQTRIFGSQNVPEAIGRRGSCLRSRRA